MTSSPMTNPIRHLLRTSRAPSYRSPRALPTQKQLSTPAHSFSHSAPAAVGTNKEKSAPRSELKTDHKVSTSSFPDDKSAMSKKKSGDVYDVHTQSVRDGIHSAKETGTGGNATEEHSNGSVEKTKKEFPEAPDPAIGMQDERGGRGK